MAQEYKLKIDSLDLKPGELREVEVEGIDEAKILLTKHASKVFATGPKCTHYGAPLSKGVVTSHGTIVCPWHGACFSLATGDVEEAPALDPITKFEIIEKDGAVYIKGTEADIKAGRKTLDIRCAAVGEDRVVVVGGGAGAVGLTEQLRRDGFKGPITMITKEAVEPFDRTKLSKALIDDHSKVAWRSPEFYKQSSIDVVSDEVTSIDFGAKSVETKSGKKHTYSKLVLASGGNAKSLPLPGLKYGELGNVFLLRTLADTKAINAAVGEGEGKKVVVIGSSFIGLEVANALAGKKAQVSVIGMEAAPASNVFGEKVGKIIQNILAKDNLKFYMNASVEKASPSQSDSSKVGAVHLKDGTTLEADLVIEGVGVGPATEYLKNSKGGPELEKDGSVLVNDKFEIDGLSEVYAIGDIAKYPYRGKNVRIEHWDVAQNQGRSVGKRIAQPRVSQRPFVPVFWSALGSQLRYCGHPVDGFDDVIIDGETSGEKMSWAAYYVKDDDVVAIATMQKDPLAMQTMELMRANRMLKASQIRNGSDPLQSSL